MQIFRQCCQRQCVVDLHRRGRGAGRQMGGVDRNGADDVAYTKIGLYCAQRCRPVGGSHAAAAAGRIVIGKFGEWRNDCGSGASSGDGHIAVQAAGDSGIQVDVRRADRIDVRSAAGNQDHRSIGVRRQIDGVGTAGIAGRRAGHLHRRLAVDHRVGAHRRSRHRSVHDIAHHLVDRRRQPPD